MSNLNVVVLIGRLTADPELRYTPNGKAVCNFSIAVNRVYARNKEVDFFEVTCWGKAAEATANHMAKGLLVAVEGELRQERWTNDQGQNRSKVKVNAQQVRFLSWKSEGSGTTTGWSREEQEPTSEIDDGDVPF